MNKAQRDIRRKTRVLEHAARIGTSIDEDWEWVLDYLENV